MATINKLCVHHFGGIGNDYNAKSSTLTEAHINNAHRDRWPNFPSKLNGSFIGYNVIIWPDGTMKQYRYLGEDTAAAVGSNSDTFHICLAGNFTKGVENPTPKQIDSLRQLGKAALRGSLDAYNIKVLAGTKLDFSLLRIYPHRILQPNHTECYGNSLSDDWARLLIMNDEMPVVPRLVTLTDEDLNEGLSLIQKVIAFLLKLQAALSKPKVIGSDGALERSDEGLL